MAKANYSKIPTKRELAKQKVGGAKPVVTDHLTQAAVQYALDHEVNNDASFKSADPKRVATEVKSYLTSQGFGTEENKIKATSAGVKDSGANIHIYKDKKSGLWFARKL
jgi:hypothetical protein